MNDFDLNNENFDKHPEFIISKIINEHSNKIYTTVNMLNPYDYDLNCFNKKSNQFLGYVECEKSNHGRLWGINWEHSFLARKIYDIKSFDTINYFKKSIFNHNADKTVYIKFNYNYGLDDCICCSIKQISKFSLDYYPNPYDYHNWIFRTNKNNPNVARNINNCIKYIEDFFLNGVKE